jgi:hypothetical protein
LLIIRAISLGGEKEALKDIISKGKRRKKGDDLLKSRRPGLSRGQGIYKDLKALDSGFRRDDEKGCFQTFYGIIKGDSFPAAACELKICKPLNGHPFVKAPKKIFRKER